MSGSYQAESLEKLEITLQIHVIHHTGFDVDEDNLETAKKGTGNDRPRSIRQNRQRRTMVSRLCVANAFSSFFGMRFC